MFLYSYEDILHDIKQKNLKEDEYLIVDYLEDWDENVLNYYKKLYVNNFPHNDTPNIHTKMILDYLRFQGYDVALFFETYRTHSRLFLEDYYQSMPYEGFIEFVDAVLRFTGQKNPRALQNYGRIACEEDQTFVNFLLIMLKFVPIQAFYELVPSLSRNFSSGVLFQHVTCQKTQDGKYKEILLFKRFDNFISDAPFWDEFWAVGILEGIPRKKNINYADSKIVYCQYDLMSVLQRDYAYLGFQVEENHGTIYVNGKEYARKVVLKKERIKCRYSLSSNIINIFQHVMKKHKNTKPKYREIYSDKPLEFHEIKEDDLEDLVKNRQAIICYRVIRDLIDEKEGFILKEGEMYNLPYSRFELFIDPKDRVPLSRSNRLLQNVDTLKIHLSKLRHQVLELEQANELARCQARAAEEARKEVEELNRTLEQKVRDRTIELERAKNEIELASRQKTNLFINLAHETKTPLTLIRNFLEQYIDKVGITEELQVIRQNISKLCRDVVNFLDAEKLEKGQVFYNHEQIFDLSEMVTHKVVLFKEMAKQKAIILVERVEEKLYLQADPFAIDRVINNLLDNAIRYTNHDGNIEVILDSEGDRIRFRVRDTGIGISGDKLKNIFEPYHQLSHEKRNVQGIGMGLYIVKKILDALQATVEVESQVNQGSCFTVVFKKHTLQAHNVVQQHLTYSQPLDNIPVFELQEGEIQTNRPTVFLVEDNLNLLYYMHSNLRDTYNVFWATNGQEALEKFPQLPRPDIIVSDIMMDVMDGYQLYEKLSRVEQYRDIPFIFLTARTSLDEKLKGLSSGAIDYIYKPFLMSELAAKIASIIRNQEVKKALYEREKYTTLGMLFGEISHELLNPLEGIYAPLENLEKQCKKVLSGHPNELTGYFDRIYKNLQRMQDLLTSLKILRYRKEIKRTPVQIEEILRSVIELFQETIKHRITINYHIDKEVEIQGNREALMHILINLLSNAIDAIESEGKIAIAVGNKENKPAISIKDTGCGIAPREIEKIFDAFYTSKEIGQGTGLGLYIVKDLVHKLGWHVEVQSTLGKGTEVLITT